MCALPEFRRNHESSAPGGVGTGRQCLAGCQLHDHRAVNGDQRDAVAMNLANAAEETNVISSPVHWGTAPVVAMLRQQRTWDVAALWMGITTVLVIFFLSWEK
jgi:hypothetical protein